MAAHQASLSFTNSWSLLKLMSIESPMPSNHLILCHPLLLLPSIFPSIRFFFTMRSLFPAGGRSSEASASASILTMNIQGWFPLGLTGLIFFLSKGLLRIFSNTTAWKHLLQCSAFFTVQLSHLYTITGKTTALTIWTFISKVMSLPFNTLFRFFIAFLPRSKCFLISWLQSPSAVILEPKKIKSVTVSTFSPSICHEVIGVLKGWIQLYCR